MSQTNVAMHVQEGLFSIGTPISEIETEYWNRGQLVAGVDEAGRGALAGPVVAAAVVLPPHTDIPRLRDSKRVSERERDVLFDEVLRVAVSWTTGIVHHDVIDEINILQATMRAMRVAIDGVSAHVAHVLIDGNRYTGGGGAPYTTVVDGDALVHSISAASIIAKVTRDRLMRASAVDHVEYGFERHKGYGTAAHYEAIRRNGPSAIHRMTFLKKLRA